MPIMRIVHCLVHRTLHARCPLELTRDHDEPIRVIVVPCMSDLAALVLRNLNPYHANPRIVLL